MPTIGTRAHAAIALELAAEGFVSRDWKYLSGGSMRSVFLHKPTGVVYKVERWGDADYGNASEWKHAKALARMAWKHVYIPKVSLFRLPGGPVLAMEYIEGTMGSQVARDYGRNARLEMFYRGRFIDMHGDNFMFRADGTLVPVDMGSKRLRAIDYPDPEGDEVDRRLLSCGDGSCWGLN